MRSPLRHIPSRVGFQFKVVSVDKSASPEAWRIVLFPNCSISWRELVLFYLFTCLVALAIGIFFTL